MPAEVFPMFQPGFACTGFAAGLVDVFYFHVCLSEKCQVLHYGPVVALSFIFYTPFKGRGVGVLYFPDSCLLYQAAGFYFLLCSEIERLLGLGLLAKSLTV